MALGEVLGQMLGFPIPQWATKPLLIPFLAGYFISKYGLKSKLSKWLMLSLFFSWVGDYLFLFQEEGAIYFTAAMVSFLIALLIYIYVYRKHAVNESNTELTVPQQLRYVFVIVFFIAGLYSITYPQLGALKIPLAVYVTVVGVMVISALYRYGRTANISFLLTLIGSVMFMLGNGIMAVNRFLEPIPWGGFWVMLSYMSAQYFIGEGLMQHRNRVPA